MPVKVIFYAGFAQDQNGLPVPVIDDRTRINAVPELITLGSSTAAAAASTLVAQCQGTEVFKLRIGAAPHANDITYAIGERVTVRLAEGDQIFFAA